ncbi:hypothetical protein LINPERHAP1_LOCUS40453 [Linum perenne]
MLTATTEPLHVRCCPSSKSEEPGCGWLPFGFCVESAAWSGDRSKVSKRRERTGARRQLLRSVSQAPEGEGSLPCDGFNHVFDLVKKGNKAFRDNSFEEQAIHLLASICVNYNLDFQKEKERVENVIQKERQRVAKLEAIVTKLSTTVLKAADEPFSYIDQDSMASDDEEAQTSEKDDD